MRKLVTLLMITFLVGCAAPANKHPEMTQHYDWTLFQVTEKGLYSVEMVFKDKMNMLRKGDNSVDVVIHDARDKDVEGARLSVTPRMPMKKMDSPEKTMITEVGRGRYTIGNIVIPEEGHWQLKVTVGSGSSSDTAVFDFPGMKGASGEATDANGHGEGDMAMVPRPGSDAFSPKQMSGNHLFMVSYVSEASPIPINKIHSWKLTVKTASGEPVSVAVISIDGRMPEHKHGLPTRPQVTENLGGGTFRVEGMKFQMPGWWEVSFGIKTGGKEDKVVFNLDIK